MYIPKFFKVTNFDEIREFYSCLLSRLKLSSRTTQKILTKNLTLTILPEWIVLFNASSVTANLKLDPMQEVIEAIGYLLRSEPQIYTQKPQKGVF